MVDVRAESTVGGTIFHREMIQREISRVLVLNLSGKASGDPSLARTTLTLTAAGCVVSVFNDNSSHFCIIESKRHHRPLLHI